MSLPKFPEVPEGYTINDSIAQIITSIAMEEIGLSHIINAEGEKIQYILGTLEGSAGPQQQPPTFEQILELNESVKDMLGQVSFSQMFLMGKMQAALNAYKTNVDPPSPPEMSQLVSGGGRDRLITLPELNLAFERPVFQVRNDISFDEITLSDFSINTDGNYQISYQLALHPEVDDGTNAGVNAIAELTSANLGVLDTLNFGQGENLQMSSITLDLQAGDTISMVLRSNQADNFYVSSQVISFVRM